jgi:tetratricopeptide (TPR) repeat protein
MVSCTYDLRGADDEPFTITAALAGLLRGLGVEGSGIPEDADEARVVYRSVLTHRRALIILDNARDAAQVRSLLPGPSPSAVLVTSRNQCTDLEAATHVALPVLTAQEALDLLCRHVGSARVAAERQTAEALAQASGHLPLALGVIASRLASRPRWTLRSMLDRLVDTRTRLDKLDVGDVMVTASFDLSCRELSSWSTEVFQAAAQIPGETFSVAAVAALLGVDDRPVGRTLDELVDENMLQAVGSRRYRYHDLLRLYAVRRAADRKRADDQDGTAAGSTPVSRLSDWYLAQTVAAMRLVYPDMVRLPTEFDDTGMRFEDVDAALAWLDDELGTLVALITAADAGQVRARSWELADQLRGYFFERRDAVPWLATGRAGLAAAEFADDHRAQAAMHQTIGQARWSVGKHELALESYQRGVTAAKRSGWLVGEAYLLHNLGLVHAELGRVDEARELYERALKAGTGPEFTYVRAVILNDLGTVCTEQGRLVEAVDYFRAALKINERAGRGPAPMANHSNLGMVLRQLEAFHPAREHLETALAYNRETASLIGQVSVLDELSQLHQQLGEWCAAVDNATEALRIAKTLDDPKAEAGVMNSLGFALLGARAVTDAQTWFETSLRLSRERGYQYYEAQARIGVAAATLAIGAVEKARTAASEALEITRRRRYRILEGDALVALTKATLATGDTLQAADYCQAAGASYRSGGLPGKIREVRQLAADIEAWTARSLPVG